VVLGEGRLEGWGKQIRWLDRDRVTIVERELEAEAFECLDKFAQRHRIIPRV